MTASTREQGKKVYTNYNSQGLPEEILVNGESNKIEMKYDIFGNCIELKDPNSGTARYQHDSDTITSCNYPPLRFGFLIDINAIRNLIVSLIDKEK